LDRQSSSIESILKQISEEYAITFSYGNKNIALAKKVNLQVDKRPLSEVLNSLFEDSEIQYELVGDQVVLTKEYVEETVVVKQPQKPKTKRVVEKKVYVNKPITKNQKMDTIILRAMEWHKIPGLGVGIVKDNKVLFAKGYGVTDLKKKVAVDENTFFPMIWFSQTVAVVAIMQQVEKGTIVLDEKVTTY
ncbi:MAG: serine hydrolase, partial [Bacteroidota bacterium]